MLRHRLICNLKEPVHNCLTLNLAPWPNKIYVRHFQVCTTIRYCINSGDKSYDKHLKKVSSEGVEDINKTSVLHQRLAISKKTAIQEHLTGLHKHVDNLKSISKENPVATLHNIYQSVHNNMEGDNFIKLQLSRIRNKWYAEFSVKWPEELKFSANASSKIMAKKLAAAKCMNWLTDNGYIINNKPKLFDDEEMKNMLLHDRKLNIKPEFIKEINRLIHIYEMSIESIVQNPENEEFVWLRENKELYDNVGDGKAINPFSKSTIKLGAKKMNKIQSELSARLVYRNTDLPICQIRNDILSLLRDNQVLVIKGDTGCGKTTQVPQFIFDDAIKNGTVNNCAIAITQPRRISAISLAKRIAFERNENIGHTIGYEVRLNKVLPRLHCGMLFSTTGLLLLRLQQNPDLRGFSHIIVDEAHERDIEIDMLLALLKEIRKRNSTLKIIVMSATINAEIFKNYFNCPIIEVRGRMYPVTMNFYEDLRKIGIRPRSCPSDSTHNNILSVDIRSITSIIKYICYNKPKGAILCFLPGWSDMLYVREKLSKLAMKDIVIHLVHSRMPQDDQNKIFAPSNPGIRKVILATNIAETGITISDVRYVVDSAIQKESVWNKDMTMTCIKNNYVSQANIKQRKGRAGRVQPGESYHCLSKKQYKALQEYPLAQVHTIPLENTVLLSKSYTDKKAIDFFNDMLEPPSPIAVQTAVWNLIKLGVIDDNENLTPVGKRLVLIPTHPIFSKALAYSTVFRCMNSMLTIVTVFSSQNNIFKNSLEDKEIIKDCKSNFHTSSDHFAIVRIYDEWEKYRNCGQEVDFCDENGLFSPGMRFISDLRELFRSSLIASKLTSFNNVNVSHMTDDCDQMVLGIILLATNQLLRYDRFIRKKGSYEKNSRLLITQDNKKAMLVQGGVNYKRTNWPSPFATHFLSMKQENVPVKTIHESSILSPLTVFFFNEGQWYIKHNADSNGQYVTLHHLQNKVTLLCDSQLAPTLLRFHEILWSVVEFDIKYQKTKHDYAKQKLFEYKLQIITALSRFLKESFHDEEKNDSKRNLL